jgi:hypothetical protein
MKLNFSCLLLIFGVLSIYELKQFQSMFLLLIPGKTKLFTFLWCVTSFHNLVESPEEGTEGYTHALPGLYTKVGTDPL